MDIVIKGLEQLSNKMGRIAREMDSEIRKATDKAMKYAWSQVPPYPAKPPNSTYTRTERLGKSMYTEVRPFGQETVGVIGNNTEYAPYVIDENRQSAAHRGRWWTLQGVVEKAWPGMVEMFRESIRRLLR
jgi:hypothetical protein